LLTIKERIMNKRAILAATALLSAASAPALALDNLPLGPGGTCNCVCSTENMLEAMNYRSQGLACSAFNDKTCNQYNPQTGVVETGRTNLCAEVEEEAATHVDILPGGGVYVDPGAGPSFQQQWQIVPQEGVFSR
jgi:hypothetical protein